MTAAGGAGGATRRAAGLVAVTAASVVALLALRNALPDVIATHWGPSGRADGSMSYTAFVVVQAAVLLGTGAVSVRRPNPSVLAFALTLVALLDAIVVHANWHANRWPDARDVPVWLALGAAAVAFGAAMLARRLRPGARPAAATPGALRLAAGERVVWTGHARNNVLLAVALLVGAPAIALALTEGPAALTPLAVALVLAGCAEVRVVVSESGVRSALGPWRWPVLTVPTERIASASAGRHRAPSWGYRGSRRAFGRAVVAIRRGPTLELALTDGTSFAVTVDDAETAAEVVTAFLTREGAPAT